MFEKLKTLYNEGKINDTMLDNAVLKNWITREQAEEIKGL